MDLWSFVPWPMGLWALWPMVEKFVSGFDLYLVELFRTTRFYVGSESEFLLRSFGFFYLLLGDTAFGCGLASEDELQRRHSFVWKFIISG
jgi:hypothetical protein